MLGDETVDNIFQVFELLYIGCMFFFFNAHSAGACTYTDIIYY